MTLLELYNLKLYEYKETGIREKPWRLLAMLLLPEKDKYEPIINSNYELYKEVNKNIAKIEKDFNITSDVYAQFIKYTKYIDEIRQQDVLRIFNDGINALKYGVVNGKEKTAEEIYSEYYDSDELKKHYDIELRAIANNINITSLDVLLNRILVNPNSFFESICDELTTKERLFILNELENKTCMNCTNGSCKVEYKEKIEFDNLDNHKESACSGWFNKELIGRSKVLRKTDIKKLK